MTRPYQGLSSLAPGVKMREPGNEVGVFQWYAKQMMSYHVFVYNGSEPKNVTKVFSNGDSVLSRSNERKFLLRREA